MTEFDPFETGLDRFVDLAKAEFVGREALLQRQKDGLRRRLVSLEVDCDSAPAHPGASLMKGGKVVGTITSGAYGYRVQRNLALAFVDATEGAEGTKLTLDLCGQLVAAQVIAPSPYDPTGARVRS